MSFKHHFFGEEFGILLINTNKVRACSKQEHYLEDPSRFFVFLRTTRAYCLGVISLQKMPALYCSWGALQNFRLCILQNQSDEEEKGISFSF